VVVSKKFDEGRAVFDGEIEAASLKRFVQIESIPLVNEFEMGARVFESPIHTHFFLFLEIDEGRNDIVAAKAALTEVAKHFKGKVMISYVDVDAPQASKIVEYFNIDDGSCPQVRVFEMTNTAPKKWTYDSQEIDAKKWKEFINEILEGKHEPYYKSEEPVEYSGKGPKVLVAKEHDTFVNTPSLNVFVEYYAPSCGHCKKLEPIWEKMAETFEKVPNVVIAKIDATTNEVPWVPIEGFPTLYIYPATENGAKKGPGVQYLGERSYEDLLLFAQRHGTNIPPETFQKTPKDDHSEL